MPYQNATDRRAYVAANREKILANHRRWRAKNKDNLRARAHRYYVKNKRRLLLSMHRYYVKNKTRIVRRSREYKKRHSEAVHAANRRRYARCREKFRKIFSKRTESLVDSYVCARLGIPRALAPKELIAAKREHLKIHRLLKEKQR